MASQLTLEFEPGLTERFSSLREVMTAGIYQHGLKRVAMDLDKAPGNLSRMLAGEGGYHFSIELMERYIQTQGDLTPIYYLIARYLGDQAQSEAATMRRVEDLMSQVAALVGQVQSTKKPARAR
jgi:hypothetical protein